MLEDTRMSTERVKGEGGKGVGSRVGNEQDLRVYVQVNGCSCGDWGRFQNKARKYKFDTLLYTRYNRAAHNIEAGLPAASAGGQQAQRAAVT